jgi:hypothetical protein
MGSPDEWAINEGIYVGQQQVASQLNAHLDRIKATWHEVSGRPDAVQKAADTANDTALKLHDEAVQVGLTVDKLLGDDKWSGAAATFVKDQLVEAKDDLDRLAGALATMRRSLAAAVPALRSAPPAVEEIARGFINDADYLVAHAILVLPQMIEAQIYGVIARWNASTIVAQQDRALAQAGKEVPDIWSITSDFFPRRLSPRPVGPRPSAALVADADALATAATRLLSQAGRLTDLANQYRRGSRPPESSFGQTSSGRQFEKHEVYFRLEFGDLVRRAAETIELAAKDIRKQHAALEDVERKTARALYDIVEG